MAASRFPLLFRRTGGVIVALVLTCFTIRFLLPETDDVRVSQMGYADHMIVKTRGIKLYGLRAVLDPLFAGQLPAEPTTTRVDFGIPTLYIHFASRGKGRFQAAGTHCEIDLPDGQTLRSWGGDGINYEGRDLGTHIFEIVPFSQERLKVRLERAGQTLHFDLRNPAYSQKSVSWKAEALPQTRMVEDLEIILQGVFADENLDRNEESSRVAKANFLVRSRGADVTSGVEYLSTFCDPLGNASHSAALFSETVWKVRWSGRKTEHYPFTDVDIIWLGSVSLPGTGEARPIHLRPEPGGATTRLLALLGPGRYRIANFKIEVLPMLEPIGPQAIRSAYVGAQTSDDDGEVTEIDTPETVLLILGRLQVRETPMIFMRDNFGRKVPVKFARMSGSAELQRPSFTPDTHDVEVGLIEPRELTAEFFIQTPRPSVGKAPQPAP